MAENKPPHLFQLSKLGSRTARPSSTSILPRFYPQPPSWPPLCPPSKTESPPEIIDKILEEAVDDAYGTLNILKTYSARLLCLISKTLRPFGQRLLFRSVTLRFGRYGLPLDENGEAEESDQEDDPTILVTNVKAFQRALLDSPHLGGAVRHLTLQLDWLSDEQLDWSYVATAVGDVLSRCPGIVRLSFREDGGEDSHAAESVLKVFADAGKQLEELSTFYGAECWKLLSVSRLLRRLELTIRDTEEPLVEDWDTSATLPSSLTYLNLAQGYSTNHLIFANLFPAILTNSKTTLQELHVSSTLFALPSAKALLPLLTKLRLLVVNANSFDSREPEVDHFQRLSDALATCPTTTLRLRIRPRAALPPSFFCSLPRSIVNLEVSGLHTTEKGISEWIETTDNLTLKTLVVAWPRGTPEDSKKALREVCEKKGVELAPESG